MRCTKVVTVRDRAVSAHRDTCWGSGQQSSTRRPTDTREPAHQGPGGLAEENDCRFGGRRGRCVLTLVGWGCGLCRREVAAQSTFTAALASSASAAMSMHSTVDCPAAAHTDERLDSMLHARQEGRKECTIAN